MDLVYWILGAYLLAGVLIGFTAIGEFQAEGKGWFYTLHETLLTVLAGPALYLLILLLFLILQISYQLSRSCQNEPLQHHW